MKRVAVKIRAAVAADASRLAALVTELGPSCSPDEARRRLALIEKDSTRAVFVAELESGEAAGMAELRQIPSLLLGDAEAELLALVVDASSRGSGIGRALMEAAEAWTRSRGCRLLRLRTQIKRVEAHAFYEKLGYALIKTQHIFRKEL